MKALTFSEFFKAYEGEEISLLNTKDYAPALARHLRELQKYHDFICQPFRPEMIEELFERFEKVFEEHYKHKSYKVGIVFSEESMHLYIDELVRISSSKKPKTIDQFIGDCQRAEIELTWKEGVLSNDFQHQKSQSNIKYFRVWKESGVIASQKLYDSKEECEKNMPELQRAEKIAVIC